MGQVEKEFIQRDNPCEGEFKAPPFLPRAKQKSLGLDRLDGERYLTSEFMQAEWDSIWTKTWQLGVRADDLDEPGALGVETHHRFINYDKRLVEHED